MYIVLGKHGDLLWQIFSTISKRCANQLNIIKQCLGFNTVCAIKVDDKKITPPARMSMKETMKVVIAHFKYFTDGFSINKDKHMP